MANQIQLHVLLVVLVLGLLRLVLFHLKHATCVDLVRTLQ